MVEFKILQSCLPRNVFAERYKAGGSTQIITLGIQLKYYPIDI